MHKLFKIHAELRNGMKDIRSFEPITFMQTSWKNGPHDKSKCPQEPFPTWQQPQLVYAKRIAIDYKRTTESSFQRCWK